MPQKFILLLPLLLTLLLRPSHAHAADIATINTQSVDKISWKVRASVQWSGMPIRESLAKLADAYSFHFLLDRRIDPSTRINFEAKNEPLERLLPRLAAEHDLGCVVLSETAYFCPEEGVPLFQYLLEQNQKNLMKLPPSFRQVLRERCLITAARPLEPKNMLAFLARQGDWAWQNLDELPHDLWDHTALAGTQEEILTLLLFGFEKTCKIDLATKSIAIVPLPNLPPSRKPAVKRNVKNATNSLAPPPTVPLSRRRFTLKVEEQRLDMLLEALTRRLELELVLDKKSLEEKGVTLDRRVSFEVKNANATELFQAALEPLELKFVIQSGTIEVE